MQTTVYYGEPNWNLRNMGTEWINRVAAEARTRVGADEIPSEADLLRLLEEDGVRLYHEPVAVPSCVLTERGPVITLPLDWRGEEGDRTLPHEAGHAMTRPGGGSLLRFLWPDDPKIERLARLWDRRDEIYADAFAAAWSGR